MRTKIALIAPLLGVGCLAAGESSLETEETQTALIGGDIAADTDDPGVVALQINGNILCTGSLITPRAILTAAHCIDMFGSDPNLSVYFGSDTEGPGLRVSTMLKDQHPDWGGNVPSNFDVGVVILSAPQDPALALPMNTDPAENHIGQPYRHVGFGVSNREPRTIDGKKRSGTVTIADVNSNAIISNDEDIVVCSGDSGGPGFITVDGVEVIAGIHSYTSTTMCLPPGGDTAVDRHAENYIVPWLDENDPSCGRDWLCAPLGCSADPDCESCGPDGTCDSNCPLPDPDCGGSGFGEICQTNTQCDGAPCVTWAPDTNFKFCSRTCSLGGSDCPDGMSCRTVQPHGDVCFFDEPPQGVVGDECTASAECGSYICDQGQCVTPCDLSRGLTCFQDFECLDSGDSVNSYCYKTKSEGGCSTSSNGSPAAILLVLMAVAFGRRRLRRQP